MLLTYALSPFTTNSSHSAISCYSHTYLRQLKHIIHTLTNPVNHIIIVANFNKFNTLCHIMLLTYVLSPVTTISTLSAISCYSHTYWRQLQQFPPSLPYHVTHIFTDASYIFHKLYHIMLLTYVLWPDTTNSSHSVISCYSHMYCRQLQQIIHTLKNHVNHIITVANYNKFNTLCHIMLSRMY